MSEVLYVDTSAVLRAFLEPGLTPDVAQQIDRARFLITSRLALVESARAILRLRALGEPDAAVTAAERALDSIWARFTIWEVTPEVAELAGRVAPARPLGTLDALHLATFLLARRRLGDAVSLLTTDERLRHAAG